MIWGKTFRFNWNCCNCLTNITPPCNRPSGMSISSPGSGRKRHRVGLSSTGLLSRFSGGSRHSNKGGRGGGVILTQSWGGCRVSKEFFPPFRPQFGLNIRGGGGGHPTTPTLPYIRHWGCMGGSPYIFAGMKPWKSFTYCSKEKNYKIYTCYCTRSITEHFLFFLVLNKYE